MFKRNQKRGASALVENACIAYFCAEYGITDKLPIYSGGLGVLAGDIVQEAARQELPFVAIGLFYRKGYFHQYVDSEGQHEIITETNPLEVPLQLAVDEKGETILVEIPVENRTVYAQIWRFPIGKNALLLLDTDHWKNSEADRGITDQLYGGDQAKRIQQELVLALGGYRTLKRLGIEPTVYHMNEGHSAFLSLEIAQDLRASKHNGDLQKGLEEARSMLVFTNHTLVAAGNDTFPRELVSQYLGSYAYNTGLGIDTVLNLGDSGDGRFSMTMLALRMSRKANAVSKVHAKEARKIWPEYGLHAITNGVHMPQWIAPELQEVLDQYVPTWRTNTADPKAWKDLRKVPAKVLWETHMQLKNKLLQHIYDTDGITLDPNVLTVVWARRFATYKRPDLLFNDIERLKKLLFSSKRPIQVIVAGKAHPADTQGKQIIEHIEYLANYNLKRHAIFIDDYSIDLAKKLVAGADVWLNTPIFGLEASGTSGMKASANGAVQFTTPDGWAWEVDWYGIGYKLPIHKAETHIYGLFENKIAPVYYHRDKQDIPELWVSMMKETIATVAPQFSSTRMVNQYVDDMYRTDNKRR